MSDNNQETIPPIATSSSPAPAGKAMLGLPTDNLEGLTENDLVGNPIAIRMMLHYYKQLIEENAVLKNTNNTLQTYADAYKGIKSDTKIGTLLMASSSIFIGFGTNILTSEVNVPGTLLFAGGLLLLIGGLYLSLFKDRKYED